MSNGGIRKGAGRPPGAKNKRTLAVDAAMAAAAEGLHAVIPNAFRGDAHTYLMSVYKDPAKADALRLDAARAALPYERPRLNSIELSAAEGTSAMVAVSSDAEKFTQQIRQLINRENDNA